LNNFSNIVFGENVKDSDEATLKCKIVVKNSGKG